MGVRLDRTETKAPFYSPGSPDCSFPTWGQALLLCLLGEGMAISGLPAWDNAISVSKSHWPFTGCYLYHLLFYHKSFLIFWPKDPQNPLASLTLHHPTDLSDISYSMLNTPTNYQEKSKTDCYCSTALMLDPAWPHHLTQGSQGVLKSFIFTHPKHPPGPEGICCIPLEFGGLPIR